MKTIHQGLLVLACAVAIPLASYGADSPKDHPIFDAIRRGDVALLASHLREGAPVNVQSADGTTPLILASLFGTPEMARVLLDHGADPNAANKAGATALLYAVGEMEKVRMLVDRGANVNVVTTRGNTPIIAAAAHNGNLEVVKLLVDKGVDPTVQNKNKVSALASAVIVGDAAMTKFFLEKGCKPHRIGLLFAAAGNSTLELAAMSGDPEIVDMLIAAGDELNAKDNFTGHALNYAMLAQEPEIAHRLIDAGSDLKLPSPVGQVPPIVLATYFESGDTSIAKLLLERGVDPAATSRAGENALTWAHRRGFPELQEFLSKSGVPELAKKPVETPNRELPSDPAARKELARRSVGKSIALLQHSSDVFLDMRRACVSCHHQNMPSVALGWARDRGFAIDENSVNRIIERQLSTWGSQLDAAYEMSWVYPVPAQFLGYGLWGISALGQSADSVTDGAVWYIAQMQKPDGHWGKEVGGITRPPMGGDDILSTALALRSLQLYPLTSRPDLMQSRIERAKAWLAHAEPATHQELVYKLLGLAWAGVKQGDLQSELKRLSDAQKPDGGWSQLPHSKTDAWATGQSLVALRIAGGMPASDPTYQRGVDFLLRTQFDDGSWYVESRAWPFQPPFDSEFPFGKDQWISAGGTAWALMAILQTIEPTNPPTVPSRKDKPSNIVLAKSEGTTPAAATASPAVKKIESRTTPVDFAREIKPVLERSCAKCHSGDTPEGAFRVTDRDGILRGGESGKAAIVAGKSAESPLFARVSSYDADLAMPPISQREKIPPLSDLELAAFAAWIDQGVSWPDGVALEARHD